jgi:hypothetical protein
VALFSLPPLTEEAKAPGEVAIAAGDGGVLRTGLVGCSAGDGGVEPGWEVVQK